MIETILRVLCTATIFAAVYLLQTNHILAAFVALGVGIALILTAANAGTPGDPL